MKKIITILPLLTIILLYSSCKKEEVSLSENLIDFTVDADFIEEGATSYTWLTDTEGNVIDYVRLENGKTAEITRPDGFGNERVSLHRLEVDKDGDYTIYTYADVKTGAINFKNLYFDYGETIGETTLNFSDIPNHDYYLMSSGGRAYRGDELEQVEVGIYENTNQAYIYLQDGATGYYDFINNLQVDETRDFSLSNMSTNMALHSINLAGGDYLGYISIRAYENENEYYGENTPIYRESYWDEEVTSVFFHTPNTENFKGFSSYIRIQDQNNDQKSFVNTVYGQIPDNFERINADIEVQSPIFGNWELTTTGEFDYFYGFTSNYENDVKFGWLFYDQSGNIDFPQIPSQVNSLYPEVKKESFISDNNSYSIYLSDYDHLNGYDEYIGRLFFRNNESLWDGIKNYKRVRYRL